MGGLLVVLFFVSLGFIVGGLAEKKHFESLSQREKATEKLKVLNVGKKVTFTSEAESAFFVGSVVISIDYFKRMMAGFRLVFGGRVKAYESLIERGRREAVLRMKEQALGWGAEEIVNVRLETANIGEQFSGRQQLTAIEVVAYGTGVR